MLRVIFTALATFALLVGAGLWSAGQDPPEGLAPLLERSVEVAKAAARWLAQPESAREPDLVHVAPHTKAAPEPAAPPPPAPKPAPPLEPASANPPAQAGGEASEEWISPLGSEPFLEAIVDQPDPSPPATQGPRPPLAAATPSQEEWAGLIRRMLAIYERVGAVE